MCKAILGSATRLTHHFRVMRPRRNEIKSCNEVRAVNGSLQRLKAAMRCVLPSQLKAYISIGR
jgi:hypothetical protein